MAVGTVFHQERHTRRVLKLCQIDLGTMVSIWQKPMATPSSAPTSTGAASQTGLRREYAATQVSGCRLCPRVGQQQRVHQWEVRPGKATPPLSDRGPGRGQ